MPIITVHMIEGRDQPTKKKLISEVTGSVCRTLNVPPDSVRIILREMREEDFGIGGLTVGEFRKKRSNHPGYHIPGVDEK